MPRRGIAVWFRFALDNGDQSDITLIAPLEERHD